MRKSTLLVCFLLLALAGALPAVAQEENGWCLHKQMYAVPAPAKVAIDGKLGDWDLSGAIDVYVMPETRETQSAKFAIMYDKDALYLGAIVKDPTPLNNSNNPETDGDKGWDGDALQFRMCVDATKPYPPSDASWLKKEEHDLTLVSLTMWYYTDGQLPNLVVQRGLGYEFMPGSGKFGVTPNNRYQAKYLMAVDKKGYTMEYRIPWSVLGAKQPLKGGDAVASAMQMLWGRSGNEHVGVNGVTYELQMGGGFAYQNSAIWGKVIYSKTGNLPKELVNAGLPPEKPLPLTFNYDLPESSQVTLQLFNAKNEVVRVLAGEATRNAGKNVERWDGLDGNGTPLPAGKYTWKGLYHQPITTQPVLSVANSGNPPWRTDDGTGGWGGDEGNPCGSCAIGNDVALSWGCAEAGWGMIRVNAAGQKQWGVLRFAIHMASDGERVYVSNDSDEEVINPIRSAMAMGVEMLDKKDFRPLLFGNGSKVLLPPPGGDEQSNAVSGLACANGRVYVSYRKRNMVAGYDAKSGELKETFTVPAPAAIAAAKDGSLVLLSEKKLVVLKDGKVTPLTVEHLDEPKGVAVDAAGLIYVSNWGKLQNVSVFSADGNYLRSIGKPGGRPLMGDYDATGMLQPYSLTIDAKGQLWVTEFSDSPKRVSIWNTQDGRLAKEYFGAAMYSAFIWMDPEHPDEIYCDGVLWNVDLNKKTWSPKSTLWRPKDPNSPGQFAFYRVTGLRLFTAKNGRQYAWGNDEHESSVLWIREGNVLKPLLAVFWTYSAKKFIGYPVAQDTTKYPEWGTYIWVDKNDDQIIQENEITVAADITKRYFRNFSFVDKDLNIWHANGVLNRPLRTLPDGRPEYDFSKPDLLPMSQITSVDDTGNIYTLADNGGKREDVGYGKYSLDGKLQWGVLGSVSWPDAISFPSQRPGKLWGPTLLAGTAGEFTGFNTYFGVAHLYTTDGLFVSRIFKDIRTVTSMDSNVISMENSNGCLVKPKGMDRYFFLAGDQDGRVTEVLGLETVKRLPGGEYVITDADNKKVAAALAEYQTKISQAQKLIIVHGKDALGRAQSISKKLDAARMFEAKAAYDEANLYVQYKVTSPIKLVNEIPDPTLLFKGGNCLDIQLAADPQADPKRKDPAPGDLRILVSRQNGKSIAEIYRPKVKGFTGTPVVFRTANITIIDVVETSPRITLDYQEDNNLGAFTALVTIPLDVIGWTPKAGTKIKIDLGYIYGNEGGTKVTARSYWKNNGFNANVLNDVPCESKVEPAEWGEADVE